MTDLTSVMVEDFLRSNRLVVIQFWAPWNGYDHEVKNILASGLPAKLSETVGVGRINVDLPEHHELCKRLHITNLPFLGFYRDGSLVETMTGVSDPAEIIDRLQRLLEEPNATGGVTGNRGSSH